LVLRLGVPVIELHPAIPADVPREAAEVPEDKGGTVADGAGGRIGEQTAFFRLFEHVKVILV